MTAAKCPPHFWKIAPQNGPISKGVCKYCKEVRDDFSNALDERFGNFSFDKERGGLVWGQKRKATKGKGA